MARQSDRVIIWDLDHTLFNTERAWFGPTIEELTSTTGIDCARVEQAFIRANETGFTFDNWFDLLGLDLGVRDQVKGRLLASLVVRAESCLYPGIVEILGEQCRVGHRQVLLTCGVPTWQMWKFDCLRPLHPFFGLHNRYCVPLGGSKAQCVAISSSGYQEVVFIDDSFFWHHEVHRRVPNVRLIRPMWPDTAGTEPHPDDGQLWSTFQSADTLRELLG